MPVDIWLILDRLVDVIFNMEGRRGQKSLKGTHEIGPCQCALFIHVITVLNVFILYLQMRIMDVLKYQDLPCFCSMCTDEEFYHMKTNLNLSLDFLILAVLKRAILEVVQYLNSTKVDLPLDLATYGSFLQFIQSTVLVM